MKKNLLLSAILLAIAILLPTESQAYDFSAVAPSGQTLYYNIIDGNAQVTPQNTSYPYYTTYPTGNLTIPSTVTYNGSTYSVTSIGPEAFEDCSNLTSVTIPNSVTAIDNKAFSYCSGLTSITFGDSVTSIGSSAFYSCSGLTSLTIPNSVTNIGRYAFCGCHGLYNVTISDSAPTAIGSYAFYNCTDLRTVYIGNSVTSIDSAAFCNCINLNNVNFCHSVTFIGEFAFSGCTDLTFVNVPNSVTSIGSSAFSGCTDLTTVIIGNSVTSIGSNAFYGCTDLTSLTIGNSVATIGSFAFSGCTDLTSLTIPNSVTAIDNNAFSYCSGLTSLTIGNSVTSIGGGAFSNCTNLTRIHSLSNIAPTLEGYAFGGVTNTIPVYIPCGALESYYSCWSYFSNIIEEGVFSLSAVSADNNMGEVQILTMPTCTNPQAVIYASANSGYRFDQWSDGITDNPRTLTVTEDTELIGYFVPDGGSNGIDDLEATDDVKIYTRGNTIVIDYSGQQAADGRQSVVVYDIMGRVVKQAADGCQQVAVEIPVTSAGVYMVKVGERPSRKVVVRP